MSTGSRPQNDLSFLEKNKIMAAPRVKEMHTEPISRFDTVRAAHTVPEGLPERSAPDGTRSRHGLPVTEDS
jgi:hypothetical protein